MPSTRRVAKVKVTTRRLSLTLPGRRRPDSWFPDLGGVAGFPERCRGEYQVPEREVRKLFFSDGDRLIEQLDDWIAKGYKGVARNEKTRR